MKRFVVAALVIALGAGIYIWISNRESPDKVEIVPIVGRPDPSNATFNFEGTPITLKDGKAVTTLAPGSAVVQETVLTDMIEYGDVNDDTNNDAVAIIMQDGGGSGIFIYAVAYVSGNVEYKGSNAYFIGDRISPQSLTVGENGVITITYLDRREDEPLAAEPTITKKVELVYRDGNLEER